ncbi:sensor histidine kinase [Ornatilinea apprima]|uniref:sensor histidine kinase n=1 Tax=Ornatilinea apprima TaxID=1134406 RepID=UPI000946270A|nr:HAMP domain-containing sensor histidine kinase [Ornatilinea apprima]
MSLRLRLTILYTIVVGIVLVLASVMVFSLVSAFLLDQVNTSLAQTAASLIEVLRVDNRNQFDIRSVANFRPADNIVYQVWGDNRVLQISYPWAQKDPLDDQGLWAGKMVFTADYAPGSNLQVLSVPLKTERGPSGVLQIGYKLDLINMTRRTLASVLTMLTLLAMFIAAFAAWMVTGHTLEPLEIVTNVATHIIRADDLQRRIPITGPQDDEVGRLINAFNQTLERMESLFNSQRRFLADVSHELRTPLTVIKGNIGLIRKYKKVDEETLLSIDAEVDRLTRLVGDLLLLGQAETGKLVLNLEKVALDTLLLEVYQQMKTLAGERVKLEIVEIDQVEVSGDKDRLKQVLLNLVGNAVHYSRAGGEVKLSLRREAARAVIVVEDDGTGIPAEDLPHIFERFYRGEKSRTRSPDSGYGLGLSIAYWIIENHQGGIEVESEINKGSRFIVWLPINPPDPVL